MKPTLTVEELDLAAEGYLFGDSMGQVAASHDPPISRTTLWGRYGIIRHETATETGRLSTEQACRRWLAETRYASPRAHLRRLPVPD